MATFRLGEDARTYFKAGGIGVGGAWVLTNSLTDETVTISRPKIDVTTRSDEVVTSAPGKKEVSIKADLLWDSSDPFFEACLTAINDRTPVGLKLQDHETDPSVIIEGDFNVYGGDWSRPVKEGQKLSLTFEPARTDYPVTVTTDFD